MRRSAPYDPRSVRRFNQRASALQVNASKYKQKRLHFLVFPWWNQAFSMGYGRKNKKIPLDPNSRIRLWARRLKFDLPCLSLTARGAAESNSLSGNGIAQIPFFVKRSPAFSSLRGRRHQRHPLAAGGRVTPPAARDGAYGGVLGVKKRWDQLFTKNGICAIPFPLKEFDCGAPRCERKSRQIEFQAPRPQPDTRVGIERDFFIFSPVTH